jgi:hydroxymethylpyrimidine pyrophosphatase-like HAD family hydrolase
MYFIALATDYDGTLAEDGVVAAATLAALHSLRQSGRKVLLVTGRELPDLKRVFDGLDCFDLVVAENGGLLYDPSTGVETVLGAEPPPIFVERLHQRQVPISVGRSIVATWEPHETTVLDVVRELGLEMQIVFNKGAVMVLPAGINKATGLTAALVRLSLSPLNVVGVGDAENDHAFLQACGCAVAVANALPMVKADAQIVTAGARGAGVAELIDLLIKDDLADASKRMHRQLIELAHEPDNAVATISPHDSILIAGSSGAGKSTIATGLLERVEEAKFQFCVIDPEGDYAALDGAVTLGDAKTPPLLNELMKLLEQPGQNVVVDLTGIELADRPAFFAGLLPLLRELRARTARPHWLLIDEAHHMLPPVLGSASVTLPRAFAGAILVTIRPDHVAKPALEIMTKVMTVGHDAAMTMQAFFQRLEGGMPRLDRVPLQTGEALLWDRERGEVRRLHTIRPQAHRLRHSRKYAEGELGEDESFYFRGPERALNLKAQNLNIFLQMAEGVDDATWLHHLRTGDYSRWLGASIKDDDLAAEVSAIEGDTSLDAAASRARVKAAIESRYTALAET